MATMAASINTRQSSFQLPVSFLGKSGNIDPASCSMALEHGVEDGQLPQSVDKLRVLGRTTRCSNRSIEAAEDLLEGVVVALAVSAGKVSVASRPGLEQRRIFNEDFIAGVTVAHPEFIGTFLIPRDGRSCAVDFNVEAVLASSGHLAGGDAAARTRAHVKYDRAEVFSLDGGFNVAFGSKELIGKGFGRLFRLLACRMKGLEIGAQRSNAQPRDVLGQIKPMRPDVGHAARRAAGLCIDAPVPVRVVQQPVLKVCAMDDENLADVPGFAHGAHLLHHGIEAQIVTDAVAQFLTGGQGDELFALLHARGQWLFTEHMLACLKRVLDHGEVLRVRRADVDRIDRRIAQDFAIVSRDRGNGKAGAQASRSLYVSTCNGNGFD